jgi:hypothetical protein
LKKAFNNALNITKTKNIALKYLQEEDDAILDQHQFMDNQNDEEEIIDQQNPNLIDAYNQPPCASSSPSSNNRFNMSKLDLNENHHLMNRCLNHNRNNNNNENLNDDDFVDESILESMPAINNNLNKNNKLNINGKANRFIASSSSNNDISSSTVNTNDSPSDAAKLTNALFNHRSGINQLVGDELQFLRGTAATAAQNSAAEIEQQQMIMMMNAALAVASANQNHHQTAAAAAAAGFIHHQPNDLIDMNFASLNPMHHHHSTNQAMMAYLNCLNNVASSSSSSGVGSGGSSGVGGGASSSSSGNRSSISPNSSSLNVAAVTNDPFVNNLILSSLAAQNGFQTGGANPLNRHRF